MKVMRRRLRLLPPAPDKCQQCAVDHEPHEPHNRQSLFYQMYFHQLHGRWPTWTDAMAHCADETRGKWSALLTEAGQSLT